MAVWDKAASEHRDEFVKHLCSMFPSLVSKLMYSHYIEKVEAEYGEKTEKQRKVIGTDYEDEAK